MLIAAIRRETGDGIEFVDSYRGVSRGSDQESHGSSVLAHRARRRKATTGRGACRPTGRAYSSEADVADRWCVVAQVWAWDEVIPIPEPPMLIKWARWSNRTKSGSPHESAHGLSTASSQTWWIGGSWTWSTCTGAHRICERLRCRYC